MRLQYGSLINCIADNAPVRRIPDVGDGATIVMWSDRLPATITEVRKTKSGKLKITVQEDRSTRIDNNGICEKIETYTFAEQSSFGMIEGTITIQER